MSSLNIILLSWVQTLAKVYRSLASFNFIEHNFVRLSDILICFRFNVCLLEKDLSQTLYRANFTITDFRFFFWGWYFSILWDLLTSTVIIVSFMFFQIVLATTSWVTPPLHSGIPCRIWNYVLSTVLACQFVSPK